MHKIARRCLAYGLAIPIIAGLCYAGFVYEVPEDPEHAMTQAEIKLRFAAKLASRGADGTAVPAREAMIQDAVRYIDAAERLAPPSARSTELRAYVDFLRGDVRAAAAGYARARDLAGPGDARAALALSQARVLMMDGQESAALVASEAVLACSDAGAEDLIGTGLLLETLRRDGMAATAYERASVSDPIGYYFSARLKAKGGEVDNALELLEFAVKDAGTRVQKLVQNEPATWQPCADTERFRRLFPEKEAAQPGR